MGKKSNKKNYDWIEDEKLRRISELNSIYGKMSLEEVLERIADLEDKIETALTFINGEITEMDRGLQDNPFALHAIRRMLMTGEKKKND